MAYGRRLVQNRLMAANYQFSKTLSQWTVQEWACRLSALNALSGQSWEIIKERHAE